MRSSLPSQSACLPVSLPSHKPTCSPSCQRYKHIAAKMPQCHDLCIASHLSGPAPCLPACPPACWLCLPDFSQTHAATTTNTLRPKCPKLLPLRCPPLPGPAPCVGRMPSPWTHLLSTAPSSCCPSLSTTVSEAKAASHVPPSGEKPQCTSATQVTLQKGTRPSPQPIAPSITPATLSGFLT